MDCNIVKDLIPLYIDSCCSDESRQLVEKHTRDCESCKALLAEMQKPTEIVSLPEAPLRMQKINSWMASILLSSLFFLAFALITIGVALESRTDSDGFMNGFWAFILVIPATGFLFSLVNWHFVRLYKNRRWFSNSSLLATFVVTVGANLWALSHYEINLLELFAHNGYVEWEALFAWLHLCGPGIFLTVLFCVLSKVLSNIYAKMMGKE